MSAESRFSVVHNGVTQWLAPDDPVPGGQRTAALVRARVVDELTLQPVSAALTVTPTGAAFDRPQARAAVNPRAATGGLVGLVGSAARALPALRTVAYEVGVGVRAAGYLPNRQTQVLGPQPLFPAQFAAALLPDIALHREPVVLQGRTVLQTPAGTTPLPGAVITVDGIWRTVPTLVAFPPASAPELAAVFPPLYATNASATATVRQVTLAPDAVNLKRLLRPVSAGDTVVQLSDRVAIAAGQVLAIDTGDAWRGESVVIANVVGATSATEPATVTLEHPLAVAHRAGAIAQRVDITVPGPTQALSHDAIAGDTTLLLTNVAALAAGAIALVDGGAVPQYHRLMRYSVTSDPTDAYWSLPPLSRVGQVTLRATHAGHPDVTRVVMPSWPQRAHTVDLVFT